MVDYRSLSKEELLEIFDQIILYEKTNTYFIAQTLFLTHLFEDYDFPLFQLAELQEKVAQRMDLELKEKGPIQ